VPRDLHPVIPERLLPVHGGRVVAGLVPRLGFSGMRQPTVQFDYHTVVAVKAIAAPPTAVRVRERRLPDRVGKPVRPLYVSAIAVLQH